MPDIKTDLLLSSIAAARVSPESFDMDTLLGNAEQEIRALRARVERGEAALREIAACDNEPTDDEINDEPSSTFDDAYDRGSSAAYRSCARIAREGLGITTASQESSHA